MLFTDYLLLGLKQVWPFLDIISKNPNRYTTAVSGGVQAEWGIWVRICPNYGQWVLVRNWENPQNYGGKSQRHTFSLSIPYQFSKLSVLDQPTNLFLWSETWFPRTARENDANNYIGAKWVCDEVSEGNLMLFKKLFPWLWPILSHFLCIYFSSYLPPYSQKWLYLNGPSLQSFLTLILPYLKWTIYLHYFLLPLVSRERVISIPFKITYSICHYWVIHFPFLQLPDSINQTQFIKLLTDFIISYSIVNIVRYRILDWK